ncbi:MAG: hypothetical protein ACTHN7_10405, partial [Solirubrobacterales bacterium]
LLAVAGALAAATSAMGWLMSFGLQALFFWAVFLQRKNLAESLIGIATGPGAPGRDGSLRLLALYAGARTMRRPFRGLPRSARSATDAPGRMAGGIGARLGGGRGRKGAPGAPAPRFGSTHSAPIGDGHSPLDAPSAGERQHRRAATGEGRRPASEPSVPPGRGADKGAKRRRSPEASTKKETPSAIAATGAAETRPATGRSQRSQPERPAPASPSTAAQAEGKAESDLSAELREERERRRPASKRTSPPNPPKAATPGADAPKAPPRRRRRWRRGRAR